MTRAGRFGRWAIVIGLLGANAAQAGEFRFVATQIAPDRAIWQPSLVLIDNKTDLEGGLVFILENRTLTPHVFHVAGLSRLTGEPLPGGEKTEPLSLTVEPNETQRVRVDIQPLQGAAAEGRQFRVRCLIHAEGHLPGAIFVVTDSFRHIP